VGLAPSETIAAVYTGEAIADRVVRSSGIAGVDLAADSRHFDEFNLNHPDRVDWPVQSAVRDFLGNLEGRLDIVLIDCAPTLLLPNWAALVVSDGVVGPLQAEDFGAQGVIDTMAGRSGAFGGGFRLPDDRLRPPHHRHGRGLALGVEPRARRAPAPPRTPGQPAPLAARPGPRWPTATGLTFTAAGSVCTAKSWRSALASPAPRSFTRCRLPSRFSIWVRIRSSRTSRTRSAATLWLTLRLISSCSRPVGAARLVAGGGPGAKHGEAGDGSGLGPGLRRPGRRPGRSLLRQRRARYRAPPAQHLHPLRAVTWFGLGAYDFQPHEHTVSPAGGYRGSSATPLGLIESIYPSRPYT